MPGRKCDCGACKRCKHRDYMREWYARNREKALATAAKSRDTEERREAARQRAREWHAANRERAKATSRERYLRTRVLVGRPTGSDHHLWKGGEVGYHALHRWVVRHRGRPAICEHCGTTTAKRFEWANVDHRYRRELGDWLRLCTSCHRRYDYEHGLAEKGGRRTQR